MKNNNPLPIWPAQWYLSYQPGKNLPTVGGGGERQGAREEVLHIPSKTSKNAALQMRHISRININTDTYTFIWIGEENEETEGNKKSDVIHMCMYHEREHYWE